MAINRQLLNNGDFALPRKTIPVPKLRKLFTGLADGEIPTLTVRALTGNELYLASEQRSDYSLRRVLLKAINESVTQEAMIQAVVSTVMDPERTSEEYAYRLAVFRFGVIEEDGKPTFTEMEVARIGEMFPVVIPEVTTEILSLCQEGPQVGES